MPVYEFQCKGCRKVFTSTMRVSDLGKKKVSCPKCKGRKVEQIFTSFSVQTRKKS